MCLCVRQSGKSGGRERICGRKLIPENSPFSTISNGDSNEVSPIKGLNIFKIILKMLPTITAIKTFCGI